MIITFPVQEFVSPHFSVCFHEAKGKQHKKKCTGVMQYSLYAFGLQISSSAGLDTHDICIPISQ